MEQNNNSLTLNQNVKESSLADYELVNEVRVLCSLGDREVTKINFVTKLNDRPALLIDFKNLTTESCGKGLIWSSVVGEAYPQMLIEFYQELTKMINRRDEDENDKEENNIEKVKVTKNKNEAASVANVAIDSINSKKSNLDLRNDTETEHEEKEEKELLNQFTPFEPLEPSLSTCCSSSNSNFSNYDDDNVCINEELIDEEEIMKDQYGLCIESGSELLSSDSEDEDYFLNFYKNCN